MVLQPLCTPSLPALPASMHPKLACPPPSTVTTRHTVPKIPEIGGRRGSRKGEEEPLLNPASLGQQGGYRSQRCWTYTQKPEAKFWEPPQTLRFQLHQGWPIPSCVFQGKAIFMGQEERMLSSLSPTNIYVRPDIEILEGTKSDFFISSTQGGPEEYDGLALRKPGRCSQTKPHSAFYIVLICLHPALRKEKKELLIIYYHPELKITE